MVTLLDRRDYYDNQNGTKTILAMVGGALVIPKFNHLGEPQQATTEILNAIPEADIEGYLAAKWLKTLNAKITEEANKRVDLIIDPGEKPHWMGVADAFTRQHNLWIEEKLAANDEQRAADVVSYPPLTQGEKDLWAYLATIQKLTSKVRDKAREIEISFAGMTSAGILAITIDDIINHILWP